MPERLDDAEQFVTLAEQSARAGALVRRSQPACAVFGSSRIARGACELASHHGLLVAMHVAESHEELELLAAGSGPFRVFLEELGVWERQRFRTGRDRSSILQILAAAPRSPWSFTAII